MLLQASYRCCKPSATAAVVVLSLAGKVVPHFFLVLVFSRGCQKMTAAAQPPPTPAAAVAVHHREEVILYGRQAGTSGKLATKSSQNDPVGLPHVITTRAADPGSR